ncbi:ABC transporter ATP-binding protein [Thalassospiraceae bacterium LMO-JJ14]|nr:ABC transporter ATP-binding protein [Thalassospiraceae bacterium LMO-JJ14]
MIKDFLKLISVIDRSTRNQALVVLLSMWVAMFLETISIATIFPFVGMLSDPSELPTAVSRFNEFFPIFDLMDKNNILMALAFLLLGLFVLKNFFLLTVHWIQAKYTKNNTDLAARKMMNYYMYAPYTLHIERNSADFFENINSACRQAFGGALMSYLILLSESMVVLGMLSFLLFVDFFITLFIVATLSALILVYYAVFRKRLIAWGKREIEARKIALKSLHHGLGSIKETRVLGKEDFFVTSFSRAFDDTLKFTFIRQIMAVIPRLWIETVIVSFGLMAILYFAMTLDEPTSIFPYLSVYAVAAMRLVPSANRIIGATNVINNSRESIEIVAEDISAAKALPTRRPEKPGSSKTFTGKIVFSDVSFRYPNADRDAIKSLNFDIAAGTSIGIVGASGAGKTTIVDLLLGLLSPTKGRILLDEYNQKEVITEWQQHVGYVPQTIYLLDDTIQNNIALGIEEAEIDNEAVDQAIKLARLSDVVADSPKGKHTVIGEGGVRLSVGQRQRIGIARALYRNPAVLIFDEATSALDNETESEVVQSIDELKGLKTVILIAHRLSTIKNCDRLLVMKDGELVGVGPFQKLREENEVFKNLASFAHI